MRISLGPIYIHIDMNTKGHTTDHRHRHAHTHTHARTYTRAHVHTHTRTQRSRTKKATFHGVNESLCKYYNKYA